MDQMTTLSDVRNDRPCEWCGIEFVPKKAKGRFCSKRCAASRPRGGRTLCTFPECGKVNFGHGFCSGHYWQKFTAGRELQPIRNNVGCSFTGCGRPHKGKGLCRAHLDQQRRGIVLREIRPWGTGPHKTVHGYAVISVSSDHPLGFAGNQAYEHRVVLYEQIGAGTHHCYWQLPGCAEWVTWELTWPKDGEHSLIVDHLDRERKNNDPTNLVPSCSTCNVKRVRS